MSQLRKRVITSQLASILPHFLDSISANTHIKTLVQLACPIPFPMGNGFAACNIIHIQREITLLRNWDAHLKLK